MEDKAYYITGLELSILLDSLGMEKCYCFALNLEEKLSPPNVIRAICQMNGEGWIEVTKEKVIVHGEIREILEQIPKAERIIQVQTEERESLCYLGDQIAILTIVRGGQFRLKEIAYKELPLWIYEELGITKPLEEEKSIPQKENQRIWVEKERLERGEFSYCRMLMKMGIMDREGREMERKILFKGLLNPWIVECEKTGKVKRVQIYDQEEKKRMINQWKEWGME